MVELVYTTVSKTVASNGVQVQVLLRAPTCECGGTGRHNELKIRRLTAVRVQVPPFAPNTQDKSAVDDWSHTPVRRVRLPLLRPFCIKR